MAGKSKTAKGAPPVEARARTRAGPAPAPHRDPGPAGAILDLQRTHGNRFVAGMLQAFAQGGGQPLDPVTRSFFEARFGRDLSATRIHTGPRTAAGVSALNAVAATTGTNVAFAPGKFAPQTSAGRRLLAHELTHVLQQTQPGAGAESMDSAEREAAVAARSLELGSGRIAFSGGHPPGIMCQAAGAAAAPPSPAQEALEYLRSMKNFIATLRTTVLYDLPRVQPIPIHVGYAQQFRLHEQLSQRRVAAFLTQARTIYERNVALLPANDPLRLQLREAYVDVLREIRLAADAALTVSSTLDETRVAAPERALYAANLASWIEASPMTSAGLAGTTTFQQGDADAAARAETVLEEYLDGLIQTLPGLHLTDADRSSYYERIQIALRRAFVTVAAGPSGTIDVRAISNDRIAGKYRQVISLLQGGIPNAPQRELVTFGLTWQLPPDPVDGDAEIQHSGHTLVEVDTSRVPADEAQAVRFGIGVAWDTALPPDVHLVNSYWPLEVPVRRAGAAGRVRYEFVYDAAGNVRAERLGEARPREAAPAFVQLNNAAKRAQLVADFGLRAVDDRPAHAGVAVAHWADAELDQVKAEFDLLRPSERVALSGVTLVRDHRGPGADDAGYTHTGSDPAHDAPGPPAHGPPHIHYYDRAFEANTRISVGAPGATGLGGDFTLAHEVGHMVIMAPLITANQQVRQALQAFNQAVQTTPMPPGPLAAWNQYATDQQAGTAAIQAFGDAVRDGQDAIHLAPLLTAAQDAITTRNQSRAALAAANVPQILIDRAVALDQATDARLVASQRSPIFNEIATRFGFHRFTAYAATGGENEWFPETFALFVNDPNRLLAMNRNMFLWFQAGMPMDPAWNPAP